MPVEKKEDTQSGLLGREPDEGCPTGSGKMMGWSALRLNTIRTRASKVSPISDTTYHKKGVHIAVTLWGETHWQKLALKGKNPLRQQHWEAARRLLSVCLPPLDLKC